VILSKLQTIPQHSRWYCTNYRFVKITRCVALCQVQWNQCFLLSTWLSNVYTINSTQNSRHCTNELRSLTANCIFSFYVPAAIQYKLHYMSAIKLIQRQIFLKFTPPLTRARSTLCGHVDFRPSDLKKAQFIWTSLDQCFHKFKDCIVDHFISCLHLISPNNSDHLTPLLAYILISKPNHTLYTIQAIFFHNPELSTVKILVMYKLHNLAAAITVKEGRSMTNLQWTRKSDWFKQSKVW